MGSFVISTRTNGEFQFNLVADNGKIILTSEGYTSKQSAKTGIASVQQNASSENNYERKRSEDEQHYFVLKALNGEIVGTSEMYETAQGVNRGISAVMKNVKGAECREIV